MNPLKHRTVVVPIDFSQSTGSAIRAGLDRVVSPSGLHVVHVLPALDYSTEGVLREFASGENREKVARKNLEIAISDAGADQATPVLLTGDAGLQIADYSTKVGADLIIVPSHGYHGLKRLLLGSTAERVVRHAHCSVLVLRRHDAA